MRLPGLIDAHVQELEAIGSIHTERHFVYASEKHGSGYINMDPLFPQTELGRSIGKALTAPYLGKFSTVAGPATGGIVLAQWAANAASSAAQPVAAVWADKKEGRQFEFERSGFIAELAGKDVLVVEDLLTTGGSVEKVCRKIEEYGGNIVGVSAVCNRGGVTAEDLGVPQLEALANVSFEAQDPAQCELCAQGVPIVEDIGHGDDYKKAHPEYEGGYYKLLS